MAPRVDAGRPLPTDGRPARYPSGIDTSAAAFEHLARPLLEIVRRVSGLETTFVTRIDWDALSQDVVVALNTSDELEVAEGSVVGWSDSMCRWTMLSGNEQSSDVGADFPGSLGAVELGMQTFVAVPILAGDVTLGTVCGASRRSVVLDHDAVAVLDLVAEALSRQLASIVDAASQRARAERAEVLALTDFLTGLPNRRAFSVRYEEELARSGRHGTPVALLLIDIDEFKSINDTHGHDGGDAVLRVLGSVLREAARTEDVAARLGGDEFALLLVHTDVGAEVAAARIVEAFGRGAAEIGTPCSLSVGVSTSQSTPRRSLLSAADRALYRGKAGGRCRVETWTGPVDPPAAAAR